METGRWRRGHRGDYSRFNGATAFQQWKQVDLYRLVLAERGFNGATAFQQWKLLSGNTSHTPYTGFNGATAFQQWKLLKSDILIVVERASMGPLPFSSGNQAAWMEKVLPSIRLQWGHCLSAVETAIVEQS